MRRGITLLETILFIALVAIILPALALFVINLIERQDRLSTQLLVRQSAALAFQEMQQEIQLAQAISLSTSTVSSDTSSLSYVDGSGVLRTIRYATDTFTASGTNRTIGRLQASSGGQDTWLTTSDLTVTVFRVDPVRNSEGVLTALNIALTLSPHVVENSSQTASVLVLDTTISLLPYATEE